MVRYKYVICIVCFFTLIVFDAWLSEELWHSAQPDSRNVLDAVWEYIVYFPIPESSFDKKGYSVSYTDSFMQSRSYGGERFHEGCDIMAGINERGHYPVVSVSDGCVEKMGWLKLGGYRVGIRSPNGVYFYYAHLSDYAPELICGMEVKAGDLLGFMGDTGYSEVEGTTGQFPVHLHFGIYLNEADGEEKSYDPYPFLQELEGHKLEFYYE